jgi:hypothetical protein
MLLTFWRYTNSSFFNKLLVLPELHCSCRINTHNSHAFNVTCPYDIIIGRDLLTKTCMGFDFQDMTLSTYGKTIAMKPKHFYTNPFAALLDTVQDYDDLAEENLSSY